MEKGIYPLSDEMDAEDIEQENKLREIEGKRKVSKRRNRVIRLGYGLVVPKGAHLLWKTNPINLEAIEQISAWLLHRESKIQLAVLDYLDDPDQEQFVAVLSLIDRRFHHRLPKKITLMELILNSLPSTYEDLVVMAKREHRSKRPEAAVRQNLRNLISRKEAWIDERGVHHYIHERRTKNHRPGSRASGKRKGGRPRATRTIGDNGDKEEGRREDKDTRKAHKEKRR